MRILAVFLRSWDVFFVIIQGFRWENTLLIDINYIDIKGVKTCKKSVEKLFFCLKLIFGTVDGTPSIGDC
jgi:hypothetical protein